MIYGSLEYWNNYRAESPCRAGPVRGLRPGGQGARQPPPPAPPRPAGPGGAKRRRSGRRGRCPSGQHLSAAAGAARGRPGQQPEGGHPGLLPPGQRRCRPLGDRAALGGPRPARRGRAGGSGLPGRPHHPGAGHPGGAEPRPGHRQAVPARREALRSARRRSHPRSPLPAPSTSSPSISRSFPTMSRSSRTAADASASMPRRRCACCGSAASAPAA